MFRVVFLLVKQLLFHSEFPKLIWPQRPFCTGSNNIEIFEKPNLEADPYIGGIIQTKKILNATSCSGSIIKIVHDTKFHYSFTQHLDCICIDQSLSIKYFK